MAPRIALSDSSNSNNSRRRSSSSSDSISRDEAVRWLNSTTTPLLQINCSLYSCVEEFCDGIGYCFALEKTFPGSLNTSRVRQCAVQIRDKINNLKMLQSALDSCQIEKQVPINQLVNGKFMDNYEFFCWFYKLIRDNTRFVAAINPAKSNNQRIMERLKSSPFKAVRPHNKMIKDTIDPVEQENCRKYENLAIKLKFDANESLDAKVSESVESDASIESKYICCVKEIANFLKSGEEEIVEKKSIRSIYTKYGLDDFL